jgi:hypothetical protein
MGRQLLGIGAGWALFLVAQEVITGASARSPVPVGLAFILVAAIVGAGSAFVAGEVAASIARTHLASGVLGTWVGIIAFISLVFKMFSTRVWWELLVLLLLVPAIWIGGRFGFVPGEPDAAPLAPRGAQQAPESPRVIYLNRFWSGQRPWGTYSANRRWFR